MWTWMIGIAGTAVFLYLRANTHSEEDARLPEGERPGFGPKITLRCAVRRFFSYPTPWVLAVGFAMAWVARFTVGQWSWWDLGIATIVTASWPFQEWFIHAYLEHLPPMRFFGHRFELVITRTHRAHHMNPWDPKFGLTTPHILVIFLLGLPLVCYLLSPLPLALTATAVTLTFVLNYEWVHFLIHTSYLPKTSWYRRLWRNHRLHHFKNEAYWFGLTMISGDSVLGTSPEVEQAEHSETCMTLGGDRRPHWIDPLAQSVPALRVGACDTPHVDHRHSA